MGNANFFPWAPNHAFECVRAPMHRITCLFFFVIKKTSVGTRGIPTLYIDQTSGAYIGVTKGVVFWGGGGRIEAT